MNPTRIFCFALPMSKYRKLRPKKASSKLNQFASINARSMKDRVKWYHRLGKSKMTARELMDEYDLSAATAFKAKQFARRFTDGELKVFLNLGRKESKRPLHWGHIQYLLIVPLNKKAIREELQEKAAEQDWNPKQLLAEIRRRLPGERGPGGRPRKDGLIQSLIKQVEDARVALKRLVEDPATADKAAAQNPLPRFQELDEAVMGLRAQIRKARRAVAAARRRLS